MSIIGGGGYPGKKMSLGLLYGPIVSSLDNQAALRKRNMAQQNNSRGNRPTMAIGDGRGVGAKMITELGLEVGPRLREHAP